MIFETNTLTHNLRNDIRELQNTPIREEKKLFVVEGIRSCMQVEASGVRPLMVIVRSDASEATSEYANSLMQSGMVVEQCSVKDMEAMSATKNPQDILFVVPYLEEKKLGDKVIVLEGVSDPGNVGTILRSAAWFGFTDVVLGEACADMYNPKTIRAAAGSMYAVNIVRNRETADVIRSLTGHQIVATIARDGESPNTLRGVEKLALVIGSEANGLQDAVLQLCSKHITIPGGDGVESLNAAIAASILMHEVASA